MKRMIAVMMVLLLVMSVSVTSGEEFSVSEAIKSFMLVNNPEVYEKIYEANEAYIQELIDMEKSKPVNDRMMPREQYIELIKSNRVLNPERTFCFYELDTTKYSKQYADNGDFEYLINPEKLWCVIYGNQTGGPGYSENNFSKRIDLSYVKDLKMLEFLENPDAIQEMVEQEIDKKILDCKIVSTDMATILYLQGENNDYGMKIYTVDAFRDEVVNLDDFKIYKMSEIMESLGSYKRYSVEGVFDKKSTFEEEALSLQEDGLLLGNGNGLDLLKPLTRIEAATMLLRALGESTTNETTVQTFADVPATHWGYGAAENAYSLGLIKGVGDDRFAPDDIVTGPQFATMVLRAGNHADFNWEEALDILINEGIISTEDASTMDLFTRGDMAKIIYEAIENGIF